MTDPSNLYQILRENNMKNMVGYYGVFSSKDVRKLEVFKSHLGNGTGESILWKII